ncbi:secretory pathway protein Sec39-domain-containing protein [Suillus clintonianus]|uniref:secretory pathway protein Sec39-domain-containing protein n=1 Tax=Suillus clintonianus TaxID=1904413 RepID=UPI001B86CDC7|nr:secretory pathway protein Sec39-domain-containing protein [Suillus clintonianus]KAG2154711.1 secretory pathway protein Sec39-domain-containing protein [Suillus clintonianus]
MISAESSYTRWETLEDEQVTISDVQDTLAPANDDLWVAAACVDRVVSDEVVQRSLIELGIKRTSAAVERCKEVLLLPSRAPGSSDAVIGPKELLSVYFTDTPEDAQLCHIRTALLARLDRLNSFAEIYKELLAKKKDEEDTSGIDEEWEDDPWEEEGEGSIIAHAAGPAQPPIPLQDFLAEDMLDMACFFASQECFDALRTLLTYHHSYLWPSRFAILESIPCHSNPSGYRDFLPAYDAVTDKELASPLRRWRTEEDWVESSQVQAALSQTKLPAEFEPLHPSSANIASQESQLLSAQQLTSWYQKRVDQVLSSTGMVDIALSLVQHGGSLGIPDLDVLGEDLSLMTRLVYDIPQAWTQDDEDWTLARWRSMEPSQVVGAYLAHSTADFIAKDISRLIMPYLFVLESRSERAGQPDPDLPDRLLHNYVLSAPLDIVAAIMEASKRTLLPPQRVIKNDEDVARLALACLYGSNSLTEWMTMTRIFECLPAWEIGQSPEDESDEADATIVSLGEFVTPSTAHPQCGPADLLFFFKPLPVASLSRALDILDVHLESGEIFARWNVPAPLRWFLQSAGNVTEQRAWANRMARRTGAAADNLGDMDEWESLLDDMLKLCGRNESGVPSAFGLLTEEEISSIFFSGLLNSGRFDIAKDLIHSKHGKLALNASQIEDLCLAASREFYDNASSANYKIGDMKLAYDCLDVPAPSPQLKKERDFIEATSRLSSFNIMSRPGIPILPIEIRLTKDRLSLISRVLSSNADAYKHTQVMLDLLHKLGFRDDIVAEVKTLAMISDAALQAEDFTRAFDTNQKMIDVVFKLRSATSSGSEDLRLQEASEVCWLACFQLGRHPEFPDTEQKLTLMGRALELCPADKLNDILAPWRRMEQEYLEVRKERLADHYPRPKAAATKPVSSLQSRLNNLHVPTTPLLNAEDAAALAGRAFSRVASNFPFRVGGRERSESREGPARSGSRDESHRKLDGEDVSHQASRALQRGIGWLLGADDES